MTTLIEPGNTVQAIDRNGVVLDAVVVRVAPPYVLVRYTAGPPEFTLYLGGEDIYVMPSGQRNQDIALEKLVRNHDGMRGWRLRFPGAGEARPCPS